MPSPPPIKILILTYYWPPSGGPGVQRWLKFTKYLPSFNIQPIIYTPENADYPVKDETLINEISQDLEVWKTPIWEPYQLYKKSLGLSKNYRLPTGEIAGLQYNLRQKIAAWVRGNFFIPDPKKFWVAPSVKFLKNKIPGNNFSAIISSGPPHSIHLIAEKISSCFKLPWLVDMRDPWTDIFYYKDFKHSWPAKKWDKFLETKIMNKAHHIITVSNGLKEIFLSKLDGGNKNKISVITNGYDGEDFSTSETRTFSEFTVTYTGQLHHSYSPYSFFDALIDLFQSGFLPDFRLNLIGTMGEEITDYIEISALAKKTVFIKNLAHRESLAYLKGSHLLFLCVPEPKNAKGILTGKIYEYLASGKPILNLCSCPLESEEIIRQCNAGETFYRNDVQGIKNFILSVYSDYKNGNSRSNMDEIKKYERKNLTHKLAQTIRSTIRT